MKKGWGKAIAITCLVAVPVSLFVVLDLFLILPKKWLAGMNLLAVLAVLVVCWVLIGVQLAKRYALLEQLRAIIEANQMMVKQVEAIGGLQPGQIYLSDNNRFVFKLSTGQMAQLLPRLQAAVADQ